MHVQMRRTPMFVSHVPHRHTQGDLHCTVYGRPLLSSKAIRRWTREIPLRVYSPGARLAPRRMRWSGEGGSQEAKTRACVEGTKPTRRWMGEDVEWNRRYVRAQETWRGALPSLRKGASPRTHDGVLSLDREETHMEGSLQLGLTSQPGKDRVELPSRTKETHVVPPKQEGCRHGARNFDGVMVGKSQEQLDR